MVITLRHSSRFNVNDIANIEHYLEKFKKLLKKFNSRIQVEVL